MTDSAPKIWAANDAEYSYFQAVPIPEGANVLTFPPIETTTIPVYYNCFNGYGNTGATCVEGSEGPQEWAYSQTLSCPHAGGGASVKDLRYMEFPSPFTGHSFTVSWTMQITDMTSDTSHVGTILQVRSATESCIWIDTNQFRQSSCNDGEIHSWKLEKSVNGEISIYCSGNLEEGFSVDYDDCEGGPLMVLIGAHANSDMSDNWCRVSGWYGNLVFEESHIVATTMEPTSFLPNPTVHTKASGACTDFGSYMNENECREVLEALHVNFEVVSRYDFPPGCLSFGSPDTMVFNSMSDSTALCEDVNFCLCSEQTAAPSLEPTDIPTKGEPTKTEPMDVSTEFPTNQRDLYDSSSALWGAFLASFALLCAFF